MIHRHPISRTSVEWFRPLLPPYRLAKSFECRTGPRENAGDENLSVTRVKCDYRTANALDSVFDIGDQIPDTFKYENPQAVKSKNQQVRFVLRTLLITQTHGVEPQDVTPSLTS